MARTPSEPASRQRPRTTDGSPPPDAGSGAGGTSSPEPPGAPSPGRRSSLGEILVARGVVEGSALPGLLEEQERTGRRLGEVVVRRGLADEETVARALAGQLGLPYAGPPLRPEPEAIAAVSPELARARCVLPLSVGPRSLRLAMADPLDLAAVDDLQFQCGRRVEAVVAPRGAVVDGLARAYGGELSAIVERLPAASDGGPDAERRRLERAAMAAPVVRLVELILARAVEARASDIHIEEDGGRLRVRLRVDGVLAKAMELPPASQAAVISRIKVMAGLDIAVKRRPQDGRFHLAHRGSRLTLRVSTLPVAGGEKVVLRILDPGEAPSDLDALGLAPGDARRLRRLLALRHGVLLAAGPTGSGKSSTLFGALGELDRDGLNVVTLEDPVEYRLPGINQLQVQPRAGLTFASALRAVLRQDPDVVMVGEIRDPETAEIAMAAATTGHLVLSTIHTNDAPGAITRLLDMGVAPYLVAAGLAGVVAQRLLRRLCRACRGEGGCARCRDGYHGRTGVFEVLAVDERLRALIVRGASTGALRAAAREGGMTGIADDARRKVALRLTSSEEVERLGLALEGAGLPCPRCSGPVPAGALGCPWCGAPRALRCRCGEPLEAGWRHCPACLRRVVRVAGKPVKGRAPGAEKGGARSVSSRAASRPPGSSARSPPR